nr:MAG TPA: hypothetical protein [Caudoviricetes sp.]
MNGRFNRAVICFSVALSFSYARSILTVPQTGTIILYILL